MPVTHTKKSKDSWIEIDLKSEEAIDTIVIGNRAENLESRLPGYRFKILDAQRSVLWEKAPKTVPKPSAEFAMAGARTLDFSVGVTDFAQKGFSAQAVLSKTVTVDKGWAIGGATGKPHELMLLLLEKPLKLGRGTLRVNLAQKSKWATHLLTHFRIATTDDPKASE